MVNLDKWEVIEHADVRKGDSLKIVEVEKKSSTLTRTNTYKVKAIYIHENGDIDMSDGCVWEDVNHPGEKVTLYRRKKEFVIPLGLGAVITAEVSTEGTVTFVRADKDVDCWRSTDGRYFLSDKDLMDLTGHTVLSLGVS